MSPIRSDTVGSLLRPPGLVEAREALAAGRLAPAEFKRIEDGAVDDAVRLQEAAGLDVVTDGELRRYAFFGHLIDALDGFDKFGGWAIPFHDEQGGELVFKRPVVVDKLRWRRSMCGEELTYLRARTMKPTKVTLISTQQAAAYYDPQKSAAKRRSASVSCPRAGPTPASARSTPRASRRRNVNVAPAPSPRGRDR